MSWLRSLFSWLLPELVYLFRCVLCRAVETLSEEAAREVGWRYDSVKRGYVCPACSGKS